MCSDHENNNRIIDPHPTVLHGHQLEIDGAWTIHWHLFGDRITLKNKELAAAVDESISFFTFSKLFCSSQI